MKDPRKAQVVEGKRKPPFWSVKAGARYVTGFIGNDAKERAIDFARANYADFEIIEKMPRRRKPTQRTGGRRNAT
ncbi:MAG: hypothetical protein JO273_21605 [Methylobacteriaceae bacterium]|nr:hypothetical protein [Methylobacteriaceae bacterium]MBV9633920.1 hypothetical protein [Methylobacteriaceae bacterium]